VLYTQIDQIYRFLARQMVKIVYKTKFIGFDKIPAHGPVILIANHVSYVDGLIIQSACNRPIRFIIDEFIYRVPLVNYFMRLGRAIPILPRKESVKKALDEVSKGLDRGDIICIFPEGQLTYTGNLGRFKPGIEWMVERDPVPVYPIAIRGLWDSMFSRKYLRSKFPFFPRHFHLKVTVVCGDVIHPKDVTVSHLQQVILNLKSSI
jgi:1-acyl-sn-glycerol-3-phosphate acyltransferase